MSGMVLKGRCPFTISVLVCLTVSALFPVGLQADKSLDLTLQWSSIPAIPTYYVCQQFKVPADRPYHIHRFEPLVNNTAAVHHMLLFGCNFELDSKLPHPCDSLDNRCRTWLVKWDIGMTGSIDMPSVGGVRIGKGSFEYLLLQIHWNNPQSLDTWTDTSGFRIHYTENLKKFDVGNVQFGQNDITIPPQSRIRASLSVYRDREVMDILAMENNYNYTSPIVHTLNPATRIDPGDEVRLTCWYDSATGQRSKHHTIKFGQGSEAEMCYAFVRYYPNQLGFYQCLQNGSYSLGCGERG